jgi:hypothetical protein
MLAKLGFDRRAVWGEGTARPMRLEVFQRLDPAGDIGVEIAMEARFGHPTQPRDVAIGDPLTAQLEGFHAHVYARVGMMEPPGAQRFDVSLAKRDLDHLRTPDARVGLHLTIPTLASHVQKSQ